MLISFSGKAASGKDTAVSILTGKGFKRRAFADQVKRVAKMMFDLTPEQMSDNEQKEAMDERWGKTPRQILQQVGVGMRDVHPDVWCRYVLQDIADLYDLEKQSFAISDLRFPNEMAAIKAMGGFCVRVERPGSGSKTGGKDISETALDKVKKWDFVLDNSKDIPHLEKQINEMLRTFKERVAAREVKK